MPAPLNFKNNVKFQNAMFITAIALTFIVAITWIGLSVAIGWFSRSQTGVLAWCTVSIFILLPISILVYVIKDGFKLFIWYGVLMVWSFCTIMTCGNLLGIGLTDYSEYNAIPTYQNVALDNFTVSSNTAQYTFSGNNMLVLGMFGEIQVRDCTARLDCALKLSIVPLVPSNNTNWLVNGTANIKVWIAVLSNKDDMNGIYRLNSTFSNKAVSMPSYISNNDISNVIKSACSKVSCGNSINSPVLLARSPEDILTVSRGLLIAGYVCSGFMLSFHIVLVVFAIVYRYKIARKYTVITNLATPQ
ncbi:hypothetical protein AKO1_011378 [Acrasis kona]|uniref:Uncharacterized protein n=1 Tax=Acrasis kona TaxID=1008807 RepID=A0AAW2YZY9_9EUKA